MASDLEKESSSRPIDKYMPRDLSDQREISLQLSRVDNDQSLSLLDRWNFKKQLVRAYMQAKQQDISHQLETYENFLLARKDVEAKAIAQQAQNAIMHLEKQHIEMMAQVGLSNSEDISNTLIDAGRRLTKKLEEIADSDMTPEIKKMTTENVRKIWEKTNNRIMESVNTYIDELHDREKGRKGFSL